MGPHVANPVRLTILAIGKARGSVADLYADYAKRIVPVPVLKEIECRPATQAREETALLNAIPAQAIVIACDERGKNLNSLQFASHYRTWIESGASDLVFILGGADGLTDVLRQRAQLLISFGQLTWPHMLARVMLIEQIYRAQQINAGHPYHRGN